MKLLPVILALTLAGCGALPLHHHRVTDYYPDGRKRVTEDLWAWPAHLLVDPEIQSIRYGNSGSLQIEKLKATTDNAGIEAVAPSLFDLLGKLFGL